MKGEQRVIGDGKEKPRGEETAACWLKKKKRKEKYSVYCEGSCQVWEFRRREKWAPELGLLRFTPGRWWQMELTSWERLRGESNNEQPSQGESRRNIRAVTGEQAGDAQIYEFFWRAAMVCLYFLVAGSWFELRQVIRLVPSALKGSQPFLWII